MSNRKDLLEFLNQFESVSADTEARMMWLEFDDDSIFKNPDAVIEIDSPELFQMAGLYLNQFDCTFEYKNSKISRIGDTFCAEHYAEEINRRFDINMLDFSKDKDLVDFIIYLNDKRLPVESPDDSPIIPFTFLTIGYRGDRFDVEAFVPCWDAPTPTWDEFAKELVSMAWQNEDGRIPLETVQEAFDEEKRIIKDWFDEYFKTTINPYQIAMSFVNEGYYSPLSPLTMESPFDWMREVRSTADEEPDMFLGEGVGFDSYDWEQAYTNAFDDVKVWFWNIKNNPTTAQLKDTIQWLKDCDSELEIIRDLEAMLEEK